MAENEDWAEKTVHLGMTPGSGRSARPDLTWETINLRSDQLEQIISTDVVETVKLDEAMFVAARNAGRARPKFGLPILLATLAIVFASAAMLQSGRLWKVTWHEAGVTGFWIAAGITGGLSLMVLLRRFTFR